MDDLLYNSCLAYFTSLTNFGYRNEEDVKKLLFYVYIQELVNTTSIVISQDDYRSLENALYCLYGTTCLIPYPDYCSAPKCCSSDVFHHGNNDDVTISGHFGDLAELAARTDKIEEVNSQQDTRLEDIENTAVVKDETTPEQIIDDIIISD